VCTIIVSAGTIGGDSTDGVGCSAGSNKVVLSFWIEEESSARSIPDLIAA
jgi:hypothetical protein